MLKVLAYWFFFNHTNNHIFTIKTSKAACFWSFSWILASFLSCSPFFASSGLFISNLVIESLRTSKLQAWFFIMIQHMSKIAFEYQNQISLLTPLIHIFESKVRYKDLFPWLYTFNHIHYCNPKNIIIFKFWTFQIISFTNCQS